MHTLKRSFKIKVVEELMEFLHQKQVTLVSWAQGVKISQNVSFEWSLFWLRFFEIFECCKCCKMRLLGTIYKHCGEVVFCTFFFQKVFFYHILSSRKAEKYFSNYFSKWRGQVCYVTYTKCRFWSQSDCSKLCFWCPQRKMVKLSWGIKYKIPHYWFLVGSQGLKSSFSLILQHLLTYQNNLVMYFRAFFYQKETIEERG